MPPCTATSEVDVQLQAILLKSLLKVATTYRTVNIAQAFPTAFLKPLLSMSLAASPSVRLTVQTIFHQLLDRHKNLAKLSRPLSLASLPPGLAIEKANRHDLMFMRKHGSEILDRILESFKIPSNTGENYDSLFTTVTLLAVELFSQEVIVEIFRVAFCLQDTALAAVANHTMIEQQIAALHAMVAALCSFCGQLSAIPALQNHVEHIVKQRHEQTPWFLPESGHYHTLNADNLRRRPSMTHIPEIPDELKFDKILIEEALRSSGHDTDRLFLPFQRDTTDSVNNSGAKNRTLSDSHMNTTIDIDSVGSSPVFSRVSLTELNLGHAFD